MPFWKPLAGSLLLLWSLASAVAALREALAHPHDPMDSQQAEFTPFIPDLPLRGEIGYLEPWRGTTEADVRLHYAAQYALAPRVIVSRTGPELLIVPAGAENPAGDPRLEDYVRVATLPNGHRLFRRFPG